MAMEPQSGKVVQIEIREEMEKSYIEYAMSTIVARALPDVRDGLKPVQRRILYAMGELGMWPNRPYKKSARIVGEVMGKYHPHGDQAIYDAMVRMAQDFSYRYPLVDGHGNFGSVDGDPPAAQRYTEARLSPLATYMLRDIDKNTVDFVPNFDGSERQPAVLPARVPNLLVNGSEGIAVGMATKIPPHNLGEVIDGLVALIDDPEISLNRLMKIIKGPDFPTGGLIMGRDAIRKAYSTGRGRLTVRAKARFEEMRGGRYRIVVEELPYQVNKASLIEKIAELHREKRIEGISALRDESDREGLRVVIELRRDVNPHVVLNQLYKHTQLQETFGVIMLALVNNKPQFLTLKEVLYHYLEHQREVVIRRTRFDLEKAEARAHILEGLRIALANIDEIVELIKNAANEQQAGDELMQRFGLTERQAEAILSMQLRRLTSLEQEKIEKEYQELLKTIAELKAILADIGKVNALIKEELLEVRGKFADERRTQIVAREDEIEVEDLIAEEDVVVALTHRGYIKRLPVTTYRSQRRGGKGITAISTREGDFVEQLFVTTTHSYVLFFTNRGRVYRLRAHEIPEASRQARGTNIVNLLALESDEKVQAIFAIREFDEDHYLIVGTRNGTVKKTSLAEYDSSRNGLIGVVLQDGDELVDVKLTDGCQQLMLVTHMGMAIRFAESEIRPTGRGTMGVKGISLDEGDYVVGVDVVRPGSDVLVVTEKGYGKRTSEEEYRAQARGGKGVRTSNITDKNGPVVSMKIVNQDDELMAITAEGVMIRFAVKDIPSLGRNTQGVRVMRLGEEDLVVATAKLMSRDD